MEQELETTRMRIFSNMLMTQKEDLKIAYERREKMKQELLDYNELANTVNIMLENKDVQENGLQTSVNLGCDFYVDSVVKKPEKIVVSLGLDLFVEYTLPDALKVVAAKQAVLEHQIDYMTQQIAQIEGFIALSTTALGSNAQLHPSEFEHLSASSLKNKPTIFDCLQNQLLNQLKQ
ncbi:Hypothetical predicted protein [Cloeon dipterum]|uniref:Uncharacterized protein n=1 Tax=Cloeon dipterum TaxID=197152 RepID=A0A8S1D200_9INSE|nr:Hypothetical predicted protein [Cloeon dipterum]